MFLNSLPKDLIPEILIRLDIVGVGRLCMCSKRLFSCFFEPKLWTNQFVQNFKGIGLSNIKLSEIKLLENDFLEAYKWSDKVRLTSQKLLPRTDMCSAAKLERMGLSGLINNWTKLNQCGKLSVELQKESPIFIDYFQTLIIISGPNFYKDVEIRYDYLNNLMCSDGLKKRLELFFRQHWQSLRVFTWDFPHK